MASTNVPIDNPVLLSQLKSMPVAHEQDTDHVGTHTGLNGDRRRIDEDDDMKQNVPIEGDFTVSF